MSKGTDDPRYQRRLRGLSPTFLAQPLARDGLLGSHGGVSPHAVQLQVRSQLMASSCTPAVLLLWKSAAARAATASDYDQMCSAFGGSPCLVLFPPLRSFTGLTHPCPFTNNSYRCLSICFPEDTKRL